MRTRKGNTNLLISNVKHMFVAVFRLANNTEQEKILKDLLSFKKEFDALEDILKGV